MFINEDYWSIVIIWMVEVGFELYSWWSRNPIWGSVFTWAGSAILNNLIDKLDKERPEGEGTADS